MVFFCHINSTYPVKLAPLGLGQVAFGYYFILASFSAIRLSIYYAQDTLSKTIFWYILFVILYTQARMTKFKFYAHLQSLFIINLLYAVFCFQCSIAKHKLVQKPINGIFVYMKLRSLCEFSQFIFVRNSISSAFIYQCYRVFFCTIRDAIFMQTVNYYMEARDRVLFIPSWLALRCVFAQVLQFVFIYISYDFHRVISHSFPYRLYISPYFRSHFEISPGKRSLQNLQIQT